MSNHTTAKTKSDRAAWLQGPPAACSVPVNHVDHAWRLVLLGAPGAGKGTQAELLTAQLGACHLSTGDVFRAAKNSCNCELSPAMTQAVAAMKRGELVTDTTVLSMLKERAGCLSCLGGFLLDGFPRTVAQAQALEDLLKQQNVQLDAVLSYELPIEQIVERLSGRRTCSVCKAVYHITGRPPKKPDVCDHCGGQLIQREDDRPESIRVRMEAYQKSTAPLIDFYKKLGVLVEIPAHGSPEEIFERTLKILKPKTKQAAATGECCCCSSHKKA
jgi:adenylate kinase